MAGGWTSDGAVNEQIEISTKEALARVQQRARTVGESLEECADCGEPIPEARRLAVPGVTLCIACQRESDQAARFGRR